jgi:hypothetical protein
MREPLLQARTVWCEGRLTAFRAHTGFVFGIVTTGLFGGLEARAGITLLQT